MSRSVVSQLERPKLRDAPDVAHGRPPAAREPRPPPAARPRTAPSRTAAAGGGGRPAAPDGGGPARGSSSRGARPSGSRTLRRLDARRRLPRASWRRQAPRGVRSSCRSRRTASSSGFSRSGAKRSEEELSREDLDHLLTIANQGALGLEAAGLHEELTRRAEMERDLDIARDIQTSLFPRELPRVPGVDVLRREPAGARRRRRLLRLPRGGRRRARAGGSRLVLGDVSGKSIPASLLMVAAKEIVYARAMADPDPGRRLPRVEPAPLRHQAADVRVARVLPPRPEDALPHVRLRRPADAPPRPRRARASRWRFRPRESRCRSAPSGTSPYDAVTLLPVARRPPPLLHGRPERGDVRRNGTLRGRTAQGVARPPRPAAPRRSSPTSFSRTSGSSPRGRAVRRPDLRPDADRAENLGAPAARIMERAALRPRRLHAARVPPLPAPLALALAGLAVRRARPRRTSSGAAGTSRPPRRRPGPAYNEARENDLKMYEREAISGYAEALQYDPHFVMATLRLADKMRGRDPERAKSLLASRGALARRAHAARAAHAPDLRGALGEARRRRRSGRSTTSTSAGSRTIPRAT